MSLMFITVAHHQALVLNGDLIGAYGAPEQPTEIRPFLNSVAKRLGDTLNLEVQFITIDPYDGWTWNDVIDMAGKQKAPIGLDNALERLHECDGNSLWLVQVGLYDLRDDPRTPFQTVDVLVAAESEDEAKESAVEVAEDNVLVHSSVNFSADDGATEVDPEDYE